MDFDPQLMATAFSIILQSASVWLQAKKTKLKELEKQGKVLPEKLETLNKEIKNLNDVRDKLSQLRKEFINLAELTEQLLELKALHDAILSFGGPFKEITSSIMKFLKRKNWEGAKEKWETFMFAKISPYSEFEAEYENSVYIKSISAIDVKIEAIFQKEKQTSKIFEKEDWPSKQDIAKINENVGSIGKGISGLIPAIDLRLKNGLSKIDKLIFLFKKLGGEYKNEKAG